MSDRKYRAPWPEVILALIGAGLIAIGHAVGAGLIGAIGIPLLVASFVAIILAFPLSLLSNKRQVVVVILGLVLLGVGIWYGVNKVEDSAIFSPVLVAYLGAAMAESSVVTLLWRAKGRGA